jgi:hypothetical protein
MNPFISSLGREFNVPWVFDQIEPHMPFVVGVRIDRKQSHSCTPVLGLEPSRPMSRAIMLVWREAQAAR